MPFTTSFFLVSRGPVFIAMFEGRPPLGFGEGALDETHTGAAKEGKEAPRGTVGSHTAPAGH